MSQAFENKIDQERQPEVIVCKKMAENPGIGLLLVIPGVYTATWLRAKSLHMVQMNDPSMFSNVQ
jgi:hypothetical protein